MHKITGRNSKWPGCKATGRFFIEDPFAEKKRIETGIDEGYLQWVL